MRELASDPREFPARGGLASPDFRAFCRGSRAGCKRFRFPQATRLPLQWALQATRLPLQWALQATRLPLQWFETNTRPAFVRSVYSLKIDRVKVPDDF